MREVALLQIVSIAVTGIIKEYPEYLYANKFNSSDEMEKFIKRHKLPKFTQEEIYTLNSPISIIKWN